MSATKPDESTVPCSALIELFKSFECSMEEAKRMEVENAVREEYGEAQYYKGRAHSYALASLRLKRTIEESKSA